MSKITRRQWLTTTTIGTGLLAIPGSASADENKPSPFRYCLNTSTIRNEKLTLKAKVEIAAKAGYQGIEPWIREINQHVEAGGTLKDLAKQIRDAGLTVESAIGFARWIVDDDAERKKGLEDAKRDMDLVHQIGGKYLAAPPVGATRQKDLNLLKAGERYRALLELGKKMEVTPQLEVWGFSTSLGRLSEAVMVAVESGHPDACLLPDVYHLYKGGSSFDSLKLLSGQSMHAFHINDYPKIPRDMIGDKDRVYPGEGIAPMKQILKTLHAVGFRGVLSLELFNREYWKQDPLKVAQTGLMKMKASVQTALGEGS